jgi:hypothetical protein
MARWIVVDGKRRLRIVWGPHKQELRCNGMEVMWSEEMTRRQRGGFEMIGKGVGTRHMWKRRGAKWYRWQEMRRGDAIGGTVRGGQL